MYFWTHEELIMKLSRFISLFCSFVVFFPVSMMAAPANPKPVVFTQKDGSTVTIRHYGDEHYHFAKTIDGIHITGDGNGNYVYVDAEGKPSGIIARDSANRTDSEKDFLKSLDQSEVHSKHKALNGGRFPETLPPSVIKPSALLRASKRVNTFVTGERCFPVLLVSTDDYEAFDSAKVYKKLNKKGYSEDGHIGSMRDYFIESSGGKFKPTFDVYPISLPGDFEDYDDESKLMTTALDLLVERPDFIERAGDYERICPFILMHPLTNEDAATYNYNYYSHQYYMTYLTRNVYKTNGYAFDSYAFVSQKDEDTGKLNRLATIVHEFSHVLGLYDLYGVDSEGYATVGPLPFDIMALGTRNGEGKFPPTFSAFERESMGWMLMEEFFTDSLLRPHMLEPISSMHAYSITNPKDEDEYYIIEYRPAVGFDSKISESEYSGVQGKNGVFVWYVDYDETAFLKNDPNPDPDHMHIDIKQVLDRKNTYYADFSFKRKDAKSSFTGIYDLKVYGDSLVCFVLSQDEDVTPCPEPKSDAFALAPRQPVSVQMRVREGVLSVQVAMPGSKRLRLVDAMGVCIRNIPFDSESVQTDVSSLARGPVLVMVEVGGKRVAHQVITVR